ncbi:hypothetical protein CPB84DRAFT_1767372, partial [Gymnopilus junonius]
MDDPSTEPTAIPPIMSVPLVGVFRSSISDNRPSTGRRKIVTGRPGSGTRNSFSWTLTLALLLFGLSRSKEREDVDADADFDRLFFLGDDPGVNCVLALSSARASALSTAVGNLVIAEAVAPRGRPCDLGGLLRRRLRLGWSCSLSITSGSSASPSNVPPSSSSDPPPSTACESLTAPAA